MCSTYAGGCGGLALFAGGDALCAALYTGGVGGAGGTGDDSLCALCMLETVEGGLCLLEVPEAMRCVLLCMLGAVEGGVCLLEEFEVLEMQEAMRCVQLSMLEVMR